MHRTGVKASILTDCVGQLRLIETTQPPIKYPQVMGQYTRPLKGAFVLGCRVPDDAIQSGLVALG